MRPGICRGSRVGAFAKHHAQGRAPREQSSSGSPDLCPVSIRQASPDRGWLNTSQKSAFSTHRRLLPMSTA
jgi:hypothetical protein